MQRKESVKEKVTGFVLFVLICAVVVCLDYLMNGG
jgi:hypothetical protein